MLEFIPDSRQEFIESWLQEQPERLQVSNPFEQLVIEIREREAIRPHVDLGKGLRANIGNQVGYFWMEDNGRPVIAMQVDIQPQSIIVNMVGKDEDYRGSPPFAADLYSAVMTSQGKSLRSDTHLSDAGLATWKRFVRDGRTVSVYDKENPGKTFKTFQSEQELTQFMGGMSSRRYTFVLSEGLDMLDNTQSWFATRRLREHAGTL